MRPIPDEMQRYAREDTHYLLYIYDRMRIELKESGSQNHNLTRETWRRSTEVCLKTYVKEVRNVGGLILPFYHHSLCDCV